MRDARIQALATKLAIIIMEDGKVVTTASDWEGYRQPEEWNIQRLQLLIEEFLDTLGSSDRGHLHEQALKDFEQAFRKATGIDLVGEGDKV